MKYCVYKHTSPDGKVYIGITSQEPEKRWQSGNGYKGNSYFTRSIKKHGWENFKHEILFVGLMEEEAKEIEIKLISEYHSNERSKGYNISSGGESKKGTKISEWQRQRIIDANKNKVVSEETRKKLAVATKRRWDNKEFVERMRKINLGENNPNYGKHQTTEAKIKLGAKPVIQYDLNNNKIGEYISIHEASDKTGIHRPSIRNCCDGKLKTAGKCIWKYK